MSYTDRIFKIRKKKIEISQVHETVADLLRSGEGEVINDILGIPLVFFEKLPNFIFNL